MRPQAAGQEREGDGYCDEFSVVGTSAAPTDSTPLFPPHERR
jgi:hypothetical protein